MNIKLQEQIDVPSENPFKNDKLDREKYVKPLTNIIENYKEGFVLALNNEWGVGKTTFIRMWKQQLKEEHFETILYNAWENDFEDDIVVALISELSNLNKNGQFKEVLKNAIPLVGNIAKSTAKNLIHRYFGDEVVGEIANITSEKIIDGLSKQLEQYNERKRSLVNFRKTLAKYVEEEGKGKPVVFFIDELDRCRPNYAVAVLETVKHIFSVPGIVFVLSIDKVQLGYAIQGAYGSSSINSDEYLRRFIDLEYSLPEPDYSSFVSFLYSNFQFDKFFASDKRAEFFGRGEEAKSFNSFALCLFRYERLPLRVQEKIYAQCRVALLSFSPDQYLIPYLFLFLIFLKLKHSSVYRNIKNYLYTIQELIDTVESILPIKLLNQDDYSSFVYVEALLARIYHNSLSKERKEQLVEYVQNNGEEEKKLKIKSEIYKLTGDTTYIQIIDPKEKHYRPGNITLDHLIDKIDFLKDLSIGK